MKNLSDRVLELLNQSEDDPTFQTFIEDLGDSPKLTQTEEGSGIAHHIFSEIGVSLFSIEKIILIASFHVIPDTIENVKTHPYSDELPFGVRVKDDRKIVQGKLGQPLLSNQIGDTDISESYELEGWQPVFWYSLPDELLAEVRVMPRRVIQEPALEIARTDTHAAPFELAADLSKLD
jgi:hypothetical protein